MNTYISEPITAGTMKFGNNVFNYFIKVMVALEFAHALFRLL